VSFLSFQFWHGYITIVACPTYTSDYGHFVTGIPLRSALPLVAINLYVDQQEDRAKPVYE
jgi:hypothetical protein